MVEKKSRLVNELARKTGVATRDVQRVLNALGMSAVLRETSKAAGGSAVSQLRAKDLKLAVRLGRSSIAV